MRDVQVFVDGEPVGDGAIFEVPEDDDFHTLLVTWHPSGAAAVELDGAEVVSVAVIE